MRVAVWYPCSRAGGGLEVSQFYTYWGILVTWASGPVASPT